MIRSEHQQLRPGLEILARLISRKVMKEQSDKGELSTRPKVVDRCPTEGALILSKEPVKL